MLIRTLYAVANTTSGAPDLPVGRSQSGDHAAGRSPNSLELREIAPRVRYSDDVEGVE
jgi:hypothetical protein